MRRRALIISLTLLLVVSAAFTVATAAQEDGGESWSFDELNERGTTIEGKDPSSRYLGGSGTVYVAYDETNFIKELGPPEPEWAVDKVVNPDQVVDTRSVSMHFSRTRDAGPETVHVKVATWEKGTREVTRGNSTEPVPFAKNVTVQTKEVELSGGGDRVEVDLPTAEKKVMTTMWIEEYPDARWVFERKTTATAYELPFGTTWSSFLPWFSTRFLGVVAIGVPVAIGGAFKTLKITKGPPGKGGAWWVIVGGLLLYFAGYFALGKIVSLVVALPVVLGLLIVFLAYVATLEYGDPTKKWLFERIVTEEVTNPLGNNVPDIIHENGDIFHVVEDDSELYFVKKGSLKHFLAVLLGAELPKVDAADLKTRIGYSGVAEEKVYVDEDEHDDGALVRITWPGIRVTTEALKKTVEKVHPIQSDEEDVEDGVATDGGSVETVEVWDTSAISTAVMYFGIGTLLGTRFLGDPLSGALVGCIPLLWKMAETLDGDANFVSAPAHSTPAKAARVAERQQLTVARTFEDLESSIADMEADAADKALDIADSYVSRSRERLDRLLGGGEERRGSSSSGERKALKGESDD